MTRRVSIGSASVGAGGPLLVIAGPCVIESQDVVNESARVMKGICDELSLPFVFKSSFDKANRTSVTSHRGPGMRIGLTMLGDVRERFNVPVITDIHEPDQARPVAEVIDALQIPAFLCRQTDLILSASATGKAVNIKKGQFLAPWDMRNSVEKFISTGNRSLMLTERGTTFGYNNLIVDFRGIQVMREMGYPVIFDLTHSLQLPGGQGSTSGGQRQFAGTLLRAASAAGIDGVFMEVHPEPDRALCDGPNMIPLSEVKALLALASAIKSTAGV